MSSIIKVDQIQLADGSTPTAGDLGLNTTGSVLQVVKNQIVNTSGSTEIPQDTSVPQISEGVEIASLSITPNSTSNEIILSYTFSFDVYQETGGTAVLFRNNDAIATVYKQGGSDRDSFSATYIDAPNTTSSVTYSLRFGNSGSGTFWVNNNSSTTYFGSTLRHYLIAMEIAG